MRTKYRLMTPGPTPLPPEVAVAGALPLRHEYSPGFAEHFRRVIANLQRVFATRNDVLLFATSGTAALEGAVQNLFSAGDRVLVVSNGYFGERWAMLCRAYGLEVTALTGAWGRPVEMDEVAKATAAGPGFAGAVCVLCETSTGTVNDLRRFAAATGEAITVVDAVSAVGACELRTDEWGLDVVVASSAKALMTPPGLGMVSVSERAWQAHARASLARYSADWTTAREALQGEYPRTSWTPPVSLIAQLDVALQQILAEGLTQVLHRHVLLGRAARAGVRGMGLRLYADEDDRNAAVTAARVPEGVDGHLLVTSLVREHGIQVAPGLGPLEGRVFRIGHCGYFDAYDLIATIAGLELTLEALGHPVELGSGVRMAMRVLSKRSTAMDGAAAR